MIKIEWPSKDQKIKNKIIFCIDLIPFKNFIQYGFDDPDWHCHVPASDYGLFVYIQEQKWTTET